MHVSGSPQFRTLEVSTVGRAVRPEGQTLRVQVSVDAVVSSTTVRFYAKKADFDADSGYDALPGDGTGDVPWIEVAAGEGMDLPGRFTVHGSPEGRGYALWMRSSADYAVVSCAFFTE